MCRYFLQLILFTNSVMRLTTKSCRNGQNSSKCLQYVEQSFIFQEVAKNFSSLQPSIRDPSLNVHAGEMFRLEVRWSAGRRSKLLAVSYNGEALFEWLPWGRQSNITLATFDVGGKFESHFVGFLPRGELG